MKPPSEAFKANTWPFACRQTKDVLTKHFDFAKPMFAAGELC